jgi:N-glycosylase/DNA lyase
MKEIPAADFDLALTFDSGQTFHWRSEGDGFLGTIGQVPIYVEQRSDRLRFEGGTPELLRHYFSLDHPLADICASFPDDAVMNEARTYCRGLRIMRQPHWECLASFITSSMKQVAHIRQMSDALRRRFGRERRLGDHVVYTFPDAQALAAASEADLRMCGLGYRARNLHLTASRIASGAADLAAWTSLPDAMLREELCGLPGVGAKVANCVMLFAYERLEAFPIDVWIARVLKERYFPRKRRLTEKQMRNFSQGYFGPHGGYAQQYLFHHARKTTPRKRREPSRKTKRGTHATART